MGWITSKPLLRAQIAVPDFRRKYKKPNSDEEPQKFRIFISSYPEKFIWLDIEKNELRSRRILACGLNVKTIHEKEMGPILEDKFLWIL